MKKNKKEKTKSTQSTKTLACVAMVALLCVSWGSLLQYKDDTPQKYKACIKEAKAFEKNKQYKYAIEKYTEALQYDNTKLDVYWKLVENYKALEQREEAITQCKYIIDNFEEDYDAYIEAIQYYIEEEQYTSVLKMLIDAKKVYKEDEKIKEMWKTYRGKYTESSLSYSSATNLKDGQMVVGTEEGLYGVVNIGENDCKLEVEYPYCTMFTQVTDDEKMACIRTEKGECYFVDTDGYRCVVAEDEVDGMYAISEDFAVVCKDEKFGYYKLDKEKMVLYKEGKLQYEHATNMHEGVAAVLKDGAWALIDSKMKEITKYEFEEVVFDEFNICSNQGVIFVKKKGSDKYSLIDKDGKYICEDKFEQVVGFADNGYAAVAKDGKWGLIDKKGKTKVKFEYEQLGSMVNGYAPVCKDGLWGYMNEKEQLIVPYEFETARNFDDKGNATVIKNNEFVLIHLYLYDATNVEQEE